MSSPSPAPPSASMASGEKAATTTTPSISLTGASEKKKTFTAKNLTQELVSRVAAGAKATGYAGNRLTLLKGATTSSSFGAKPAVKPMVTSATAPSAPLQKVKGRCIVDVA